MVTKAKGNPINPNEDDIFVKDTGEVLTGKRKETSLNEFRDTGSLPKSQAFTEKLPTDTERADIFKDFQEEQKAKEEQMQTETLEEETPMKPIKPTREEPVVERGQVEGGVKPQPIQINRDTITDIRAKQLAGEEISKEEKIALAKVTARLQTGETFQDIFGESTTGTATQEAEDLLAQRREKAGAEIEKREGIAEDRITKREELLNAQVQREQERILKNTERLQNQTQRLRSLRGVGRGTQTEAEILELERQGQALINDLNAKAELQRQKIRLEEEGAAAEDIKSINDSLAKLEGEINEKVISNLEAQKQVDKEIGATFAESLNNMLETMEVAGVEIGDFDKNATEALGYISDSKGNPLKVDENGDPIAPLGPIGENVKISNFKDGNDNTYVYKNGKLDSIITNDGKILKGQDLESKQVPAIVKEKKDDKARRDFETQLRKELNSRQEVKEFNTVRSSYLRMLKAKEASQGETGVGDIALVFSYMKMLDPTSVVREGEFATAQNSAGVSSKIQNVYNKVLTGQLLTETQRKEFVDLGKQILEAEGENVKNIASQYEDIAEEAGLKKEYIIGDLNTGIPEEGQSTGLGKFKTSGGIDIDFDSLNIPSDNSDTFESDVDEFDNL